MMSQKLLIKLRNSHFNGILKDTQHMCGDQAISQILYILIPGLTSDSP